MRATEATNGGWVLTLRRYLGLTLLLNLGWETLQLPLYTLWQTGSPQQLMFVVAHCTLGDVLIATMALILALLVNGASRWPASGFGRVLLLATAFGLLYTLFSEWLNIVVRQSWAYAPAMPRLPVTGTGLAPLLQWTLLPPATLYLSRPEGVRLTQINARRGGSAP